MNADPPPGPADRAAQAAPSTAPGQAAGSIAAATTTLLADALQRADSAMIITDPQSLIVHVNDGFTRMFGYGLDEVIGRRPSDFLARTHSDPEIQQLRDRADRLLATQSEVLLHDKDGRSLWASVVFNPFTDADGRAIHHIAVLTEITEAKLHEVLHRSVLAALMHDKPMTEVMAIICRELERVAPSLMTSVIAVDPDGRLRTLAANGLPPEYAVRVDGAKAGPNVGACGTAAWRGRTVVVEDTLTSPLFGDYRFVAEDFGLRACWSSPIKSASGRVLGTFAFYYRQPRKPDPWHVKLAEICMHLCSLALEREQDRTRMHKLAFYDALTGLPNRMMFCARAEQMLVSAEQEQQALALLFLDIDRFKRVNETQGHAAGDGLLRDLASRIGALLGQADLIGRQAADEFVIALPGCPAEHAAGVAERLLACVSEPCAVGHMTFSPSASIGVAVYPGDGQDIDTLMRHADLAMHRSKAEGGGNVRFFSADMNRLAQERVALEAALRDALRRDQLELYYQPQLSSTAPHALLGAEVLLRWTHPDLGPIPPGRFIPMAEECGLICEVGRWVLTNACRQMGQWRARGVPVPHVAVNLSAVSFEDPCLIDRVQTLLRQHALAPSDLVLEMTESVMLSPLPMVLSNLESIKAAGISLSLDDFGTGYSSLSHLHRLPIDELKLDMSFVHDLERSQSALNLTQSILRIGESLGKRVVAEGVETQAQSDLLAKLGCKVLQGFLFSKPLPAAALETWISDRTA